MRPNNQMSQNILTAHSGKANFKGILLDLTIYIAVMFLIREFFLPNLGFLANGLFWSLAILLIAVWRIRLRNITWKQIGLHQPESIPKTLEKIESSFGDLDGLKIRNEKD